MTSMPSCPDDLVGMEVYTGPGTPPQFQRAFAECGSIVIWTK